MRRSGWQGFVLVLALLLGFEPGFLFSSPEDEEDSEARSVIQASIEAMGGPAYLGVSSVLSEGRYFRFRNGRKSFARYTDWTVFSPVKWRFQLGDGKNRYVQVYNLEEGKGWTLEGKATVEEVPEEDIEEFRRIVKQDLDILFRQRLEEEGMSLFYYGPDDIAGQGEFEAVEFVDSTNDAIVVFFDRQSHLPAKVETHFTDKMGVRHRQELEFSNWHVFDGVKVALRQDVYVDEEISSQRFVEELKVNPQFPNDLFLRPKPDEK